MAIIKCKMCGGDLNIEAGMTVAECEYCGTRQTVPMADNEKKLTLFARANRLRAACEFDKAAAVYESIVAEFPTEAEAYWGLVLCRYGIEYVDDPATGKKIPTCHRSSFESILEDPDFEQAQENADAVSRKVYREEAKAIEDIRRRIVELSGKEQPYDIFICYKETDENGERTPDSVMAQEVYDALAEKGYRVFFSRITLEDKLGTEYEPYIFAALNSAKVMLVFGTDYEYFNAVWVKNEWSRFLALIASGQKKHLIPCYKGVDAYDMPKELAHLQGQDMGKLGAVQDLVRGVEKLLGKGAAQSAQPVIVQAAGGVSSDALLKRGNMALSDGNWKAADEFFDRVLDMNAECAEAYLGKFLARVQESDIAQYATSQIERAKRGEMSTSKEAVQADESRADAAAKRFAIEKYLAEKDIRAQYAPPKPYVSIVDYWQMAADQSRAKFANDSDLEKARHFAAGPFKEQLESGERAFESRWNECVQQAERRDAQAKEAARKAYAQALDECDRKAEELFHQAEARREEDYQQLCKKQAEAEKSYAFANLVGSFERMQGYKDSAERAKQCQEQANTLKTQEESQKKIDQLREAQKQARKRKRNIIIVVLLIAIAAVALWYITQVFIPERNYQAAEALYESGQYAEAAEEFEAMGDYEDAPERVLQARYAYADALLAAGDNDGAAAVFEAIGDYGDATERAQAIRFTQAEAVETEGNLSAAAILYGKSGDYSGARERSFALWEQIADRETVSAGGYHTVGLKSDGTVVAVGHNGYGRCDVEGWTDIVAVSAGDSHTVGLKLDGTVVAVGMNSEGQCDVEGWTDIVAVSAGDEHTVGLKSDGTVVATEFIEDEYTSYDGQCDVDSWTEIVAISAGDEHTVGLKSDGTVVAVGYDGYGQCDVEGWTDIVAVSVGYGHTVGLKSDGTVVAVGKNSWGQCDVEGWTDIVAISAETYHTVGLKADGTVVAVGDNDSGRCNVEDWTDIVAVSAGNDHTVGLKSDGTVVAVGDNDYGQCDVDGLPDIVEVSAGDRHTVGLKSDGTVVAVGDNDDGQCYVEVWTDIVAVSAGDEHTVGLKSDGTVVAVGYNYDGRCDVDGWTDIVAVSAGFGYTVGLKSGGTVVAVGYNYDGRCDVDGWTDIVAVSTGDYHTVGLKSDGTVVAVGYNDYGQCDVESWIDIVAVSVGNRHTVGLKSDGTVVAVGENDDGQCDVDGWTDIVAVSAGDWHTVGLKSDGTVVAVGDNYDGRCDVEGWTDIVAISAGSHTVGLKSDGTVVAVGNNDEGQCNVSTWSDILVRQ